MQKRHSHSHCPAPQATIADSAIAVWWRPPLPFWATDWIRSPQHSHPPWQTSRLTLGKRLSTWPKIKVHENFKFTYSVHEHIIHIIIVNIFTLEILLHVYWPKVCMYVHVESPEVQHWSSNQWRQERQVSPVCDGERSNCQAEAALWEGAGQYDSCGQSTALHQSSCHSHIRPPTNSRVRTMYFSKNN